MPRYLQKALAGDFKEFDIWLSDQGLDPVSLADLPPADELLKSADEELTTWKQLKHQQSQASEEEVLVAAIDNRSSAPASSPTEEVGAVASSSIHKDSGPMDPRGFVFFVPGPCCDYVEGSESSFAPPPP